MSWEVNVTLFSNSILIEVLIPTPRSPSPGLTLTVPPSILEAATAVFEDRFVKDVVTPEVAPAKAPPNKFAASKIAITADALFFMSSNLPLP
ncbi:hypothetical protein D3C74_271760 [compost metagenome]